MENKEIICQTCGKKEKAENYKKNIKFYINWCELEPDVWLCRDCKNNHDSHLIFYKFVGFKEKD